MESPILGAVEAGKGRIAVYGDSNCLDSSHMVNNCYWLLKKLLDFTSSDIQDPIIFPPTNELGSPMGSVDSPLPMRREDVNFSTYSLVLNHPLQCGSDSPLAVQGSKGYLYEKDHVKSSSSQRTILQPNMDSNVPQSNLSLEGVASFDDYPLRNNSKTSPIQQEVSPNGHGHEAEAGIDRLVESFFTVQDGDAVDNAGTEGEKVINTTKWRSKDSSQLPLGWWNRDEVCFTIHSLFV